MLFTWFKGYLEHEEIFKKYTALNLVFEIMIKHLLSQLLWFGVIYLSNNWNCQNFVTPVPSSGHKNINYMKWKQKKKQTKNKTFKLKKV